MREVKFRAWDKRRNKWQATMGNLMLDVGGHLYWQFGFAAPKILSPEAAEDYVLQQYTGLKDKNGREIYEGDIVNIDGMSVPIEWYNGAWTVRYFNIPTRSYLSHFDESDIEIIGNIYETPNLLTNEK